MIMYILKKYNLYCRALKQNKNRFTLSCLEDLLTDCDTELKNNPKQPELVAYRLQIIEAIQSLRQPFCHEDNLTSLVEFLQGMSDEHVLKDADNIFIESIIPLLSQNKDTDFFTALKIRNLVLSETRPWYDFLVQLYELFMECCFRCINFLINYLFNNDKGQFYNSLTR